MTTWPPPEDVRAAAEAHRELDPAYQDAVIESFLGKISQQIDARVDARIAQQQTGQQTGQQPEARRPGGPNPVTVALTSLALGIPFSAIAVAVGRHWAGALPAMIVTWAAIAVINIACNVIHHSHFHRPTTRSPHG